MLWTTCSIFCAVSLALLAGMLLWNRRLKRRSIQAVQVLDAESRQRRRSEAELETILSSMTSLVMEVQRDGRILRVVPTRYTFRENSPEDLQRRYVKEFVPEQSWSYLSELLQHVLHQRHSAEMEHTLDLGEETVTFLLAVSPLTDNSVLVVGRDISERKRYEQELTRRMFYDPMSGLPNRALLLDRLQRALARAQRREAAKCAVVYLNVDRFRLINESLGHQMGDTLIRAMGQRIEGCLRSVDTVSRYMADEFVLLLDTVEDKHEALSVAERIQQTLQAPFVLKGREIYTSVSLGIAFSAAHYDSAEDLVRDAHAAMQCSRSKYRGGCEVFQNVMHQRASSCLQLETDMRRALKTIEENPLDAEQQFSGKRSHPLL